MYLEAHHQTKGHHRHMDLGVVAQRVEINETEFGINFGQESED